MSTTKQLKVYKGLPTAIKARAKGYWDEFVFDAFTTDGESKNLTMSLYDGLNYSTSLSPLGTVKLDFSGTVLPYKWQYKNYLTNLRYCFKPAGQNYDVEYVTYNNLIVVGSPGLDARTGIVSGTKSSNYIKLSENFSFSSGSTAEILLKVNMTDLSGSSCLIGNLNDNYTSGGFVLRTDSGVRLKLWGTTSNSAWNTSGFDTGIDLQSGINYIKIVWSGTDYKFYISTDNATWTEGNTLASSAFTSFAMVFGISNSNFPIKGSIDLSETYIKVDNNIWWSAASSSTYDNFQTIGTPQINQATGIASNFSSSNYLRTLESFSPENKPWRIKMKFTTGSSVTNNTIIGSAYTNSKENFLIRINSSSKMWFLVSSSNGTWDIIGTTTQGSYTFLANTTYYCEASFNGTNYIFKYSTDGENYIEDINVASNSTIVAGRLEFGAHNFSGGTDTPFNGLIDLSGFSIEIDDEIWWKAGGENIESLPGITSNYTDDGSAVTLNCFALGDENVIVTESNDYVGGTYLGTVSIPATTTNNFETQSGDTIITSAGTPLAIDGISSLTTAPNVTDTQLTFADDGNSTVSFSMQQLKDYVSPAPAKQGRFVCVSDAKIAYSDDGLSWTEINNPLNKRFTICYGDGKFLGRFTSASDKIAYSTDGINWTTCTMPTSLNWLSIAYGNGVFVAYGTANFSTTNSVYAYSTDGVNWTQGTLPTSEIWGNVYFVNGKFYINCSGNTANPSNIYLYSTDGVNWTQGTLPTSGNWISVGGDEKILFTLFGGGYADTNNYYYSTNGVNWTNGVLPALAVWDTVLYGNGMYIVDAGNRSNVYAYSSDGITWVSKASPINNKSISSFCGGKFFTSSYNSDTYKYSSDGITWQSGTLPSSQSWLSVAYGEI